MKTLIILFFLSFSLLSYAFDRKPKTLFVEQDIKFDQSWRELDRDEQIAIKKLQEILETSKTGKFILEQAQEKALKAGETLKDVLLPGDGSLTDTTLVRRFSPSHPDQIHYETRSKVYINRNLTVLDAVLDMAHELTHYVYRNPFNPYVKNFSLPDFVKSTVEGKGGEVEAFLLECQVLRELIPQRAKENSLCHKMIDTHGKLSKTKAMKEFYRVGKHLEEFRSKLARNGVAANDSLPYLSQDNALFISAAYGLPYPLAAYEEYVSIMGRACENDEKRLNIMKQTVARAPASTQGSFHQSYQQMRESYLTRCQSFSTQ